MNTEILMHRFSVAPMLGWTDRHCCYFLRLLSNQTLLYTEMINVNAILYGKKDYLDYSQEEHPIVIQLGGNNPQNLAKCAKLAQDRGYDEINFNIGCPSKQVQRGMFGVFLMKNIKLVIKCIQTMSNNVSIPITIKTRIGIDNEESYEFLYNFIEKISRNSECKTFIIHARKAILNDINSKDNRKIPPLNYSYVYQLKLDFPYLTIIINGGIKSLKDTKIHLKYVDGVMIGRGVYKNPRILSTVDREIFNIKKVDSNPFNIVHSMYPYIENELSKGTKLIQITRHMINLFKGISGSCKWRQYLSNNANKKNAGIEIIEHALNYINM